MDKFYNTVVQKLFAIRLFGATVAGILLAALLTVIVSLLSQIIVLKNAFPFYEVRNAQIATILFAACFFTFTILIYFLTLKEREDILTPIRKKIRGVWRVRYQVWSYAKDGTLEQEERVDVCRLDIDENTAKLFMSFRTVSTDLYQTTEGRIDDVMINPVLSPRRLIYYYELNLRLQSPAQELLNTTQSDVHAPIFGVLRIVERTDGDIKELEGEWYDLSGVFANMAQSFARKQGIQTTAELPRSGRMTFERVDAE